MEPELIPTTFSTHKLMEAYAVPQMHAFLAS